MGDCALYEDPPVRDYNLAGVLGRGWSANYLYFEIDISMRNGTGYDFT